MVQKYTNFKKKNLLQQLWGFLLQGKHGSVNQSFHRYQLIHSSKGREVIFPLTQTCKRQKTTHQW